jgi:hypothetical protein
MLTGLGVRAGPVTGAGDEGVAVGVGVGTGPPVVADERASVGDGAGADSVEAAGDGVPLGDGLGAGPGVTGVEAGAGVTGVGAGSVDVDGEGAPLDDGLGAGPGVTGVEAGAFEVGPAAGVSGAGAPHGPGAVSVNGAVPVAPDPPLDVTLGTGTPVGGILLSIAVGLIG